MSFWLTVTIDTTLYGRGATKEGVLDQERQNHWLPLYANLADCPHGPDSENKG